MEEQRNVGAELVPAVGIAVGGSITSQQIEDAGLLMPLASPEALRAAFAHRQAVLTSILDPDHDFLYSVTYTDRDGQQRSMLCNTLAEVKKQVEFLKDGGASYKAHPKKSGCLKLAHALGIESKRAERTGLPEDQTASYSSVTYISTHKRTGRQEEGQGYCDKAEKPKAKNHVLISMADTRAYCHAVLRCAGYDNVGADEIEATIQSEQWTVETELPVQRERPALVETTTAPVVTEMLKAASVPAPTQTVAAPAAAAPAAAPVAASAPPAGDLITNAMAAQLSTLLMAKLGSKEKAQAWLQEKAGVMRSIHVKDDQVGHLTTMLNAMETP